MIIATKGIVLRLVKYGDTSVICSVFTELLGLQSYLVKGIRSEKKQSQKGNLIRPGNILEMQVYHQEGKNLHYIKEYQPAIYYHHLGDSVVKNTILLFAVEVLGNLVLTDDAQEALFEFTCSFLQYIDAAENNELANMPLFFLKEAAKIMGYAVSENFSASNCYLNTYEGYFQKEPSQAMPSLDARLSEKLARIIATQDISEIGKIQVAASERTDILEAYLHFIQWHDKSFKPLKCLPVLQAILH